MQSITDLMRICFPVGCGDNHTVVTLADGSLYSFGSNDFGQLGHHRSRTRPGKDSNHDRHISLLMTNIDIAFRTCRHASGRSSDPSSGPRFPPHQRSERMGSSVFVGIQHVWPVGVEHSGSNGACAEDDQVVGHQASHPNSQWSESHCGANQR